MREDCNMKGFLEFQVLSMIGKRDMCGSEIRVEIGKRKGCIPSPGTVYPVLKDLNEKGLIKETKTSGKEKKYSITQKGRKELLRNKRIFLTMFKEIVS